MEAKIYLIIIIIGLEWIAALRLKKIEKQSDSSQVEQSTTTPPIIIQQVAFTTILLLLYHNHIHPPLPGAIIPLPALPPPRFR